MLFEENRQRELYKSVCYPTADKRTTLLLLFHWQLSGAWGLPQVDSWQSAASSLSQQSIEDVVCLSDVSRRRSTDVQGAFLYIRHLFFLFANFISKLTSRSGTCSVQTYFFHRLFLFLFVLKLYALISCLFKPKHAQQSSLPHFFITPWFVSPKSSFIVAIFGLISLKSKVFFWLFARKKTCCWMWKMYSFLTPAICE